MNIKLIKFTAEWCNPCKMQGQIIEKLLENYKDKIDFKEVDVDSGNKNDKNLIKKHFIVAIPTIIIEKDEKFIKKYVGITSLEVLEKEIDACLSEEK